MNSIRHFENENLKERSTYFLWLLIAVAGLIGSQFLLPIIRPNRFSGSIAEWLLTFTIVLFLILYFLFHKRFVSITFDPMNKKIILRTTTLINGETMKDYNYLDITFKGGKDSASLRKQATDFIEIYNHGNQLIKLEKTSIGDYSFNNILTELEQLKNLS
jgi:hypothetical protein